MVCLVLEMQMRYSTHKYYQREPESEVYRVWDLLLQRWGEVTTQELRAGHLILLEKNRKTPAHILPIALESSKK